MDDRRVFRVEPGDKEILQVALQLCERPALQGLLLELSRRGCSVRFSRTHAPALALAGSVDLRLGGGRLSEPLWLSARVEERLEEAEWRRYHFAFEEEDLAAEALGPTLHRLLNRRRSFRVTPDPEHPPALRLQVGESERELRAQLCDLSAEGASLAVETGLEELCHELDEVRLALELDAGEPLELRGRIQNRRVGHAGVLWGVAFDGARSPEFEASQARILQYVMRRKRAVLGRESAA